MMRMNYVLQLKTEVKSEKITDSTLCLSLELSLSLTFLMFDTHDTDSDSWNIFHRVVCVSDVSRVVIDI